jgi:hypothetical protein
MATEKPDYEEEDVSLEALAEERGCTLITGDNKTLLLDHDTTGQLNVFNGNRRLVHEMYGIESVEQYRSRGGNDHRIVYLKREAASPVERILLQALLGSDPKRELLSLRRTHNNHPTPSVLFRPKQKKAEEVQIGG